MDRFNFDPEAGFLDSSVYTDPANETQTRTMLFQPHSQTKEYINETLVPVVEELQTRVLAIEGATGDAEAIQEIMDAIAAVSDFLALTDEIAYVG